MVSTKRLEDKVFERIYDKYLKEPTVLSTPSGEDSKKPKEASPPKGDSPLSPLPVYKIPFIPIKPKKENPSSINSPSTSSRKEASPPSTSRGSGGESPTRKPSVSHGDLIGIGLIVLMIALPFLLLADWKSIIQRIKGKHKSEYPTYNPFQGR